MENTVVVLVCCQYCKSAFRSKNELHFHWFKECRTSHCSCLNCLCEIGVQADHFHQYRIYFNRNNLNVSVREVMNKHFPHIPMPTAAVTNPDLGIPSCACTKDIIVQTVTNILTQLFCDNAEPIKIVLQFIITKESWRTKKSVISVTVKMLKSSHVLLQQVLLSSLYSLLSHNYRARL